MRTLALGMKTIKQEEFSVWLSKVKALNNLTNNQCLDEAELSKLHFEMEQNLNFTAVSAKQDDGVFETIQAILKSGTKFWILTGDRKEPTIITAKQCGLIADNTLASNEFIDINNTGNENEIEKQLNIVLNELKFPNQTTFRN